VLQCGLAAVLFGVTTPLASRLAGDTYAANSAGLLYLGAASTVLPRLRSGTSPWGILSRGVRRLAAAVVAGGLRGPVLLIAGLAGTSAAPASLLLNLELVATVIVAALFFDESIDGSALRPAEPDGGPTGVTSERHRVLPTVPDRTERSDAPATGVGDVR
jgi:drug/metabolite transporter (DMT)-like permease